MASGGKGFTFLTITANTTWTAPAGVTQVILVGCGGGAGGMGGSKGVANSLPKGGAGAVVGMKTVAVVPGTTYAVTIGTAGIGGAARTSNGAATSGTAGGDTTFGLIANFFGAPALVPSTGNAVSQTPLATTANYPQGQLPGSQFGKPGSGGLTRFVSGTTYYFGGTGGSSGTSASGVGANGGNANLATDGSAGQAASSLNYGAGGGAGGSTQSGSSSGVGGGGAQGFLQIIWVEA